MEKRPAGNEAVCGGCRHPAEWVKAKSSQGGSAGNCAKSPDVAGATPPPHKKQKLDDAASAARVETAEQAEARVCNINSYCKARLVQRV